RVEAAQQWRDEAREVRACWVARQAADVAAADVWMAVLHGDLATARGLALTAADQFPDLLLPRAALLHLASRLGDRSRGLVVALRRVSGGVGCGFPSLLADHAQACRSDDGPALEAVSERFARRGLGPLAAEAANQAARAYHAGGSP